MNMYAQATYAAVWHQVRALRRSKAAQEAALTSGSAFLVDQEEKEKQMANLFGAKANQCLDQCMQQALQSFRKTA